MRLREVEGASTKLGRVQTGLCILCNREMGWPSGALLFLGSARISLKQLRRGSSSTRGFPEESDMWLKACGFGRIELRLSRHLLSLKMLLGASTQASSP